MSNFFPRELSSGEVKEDNTNANQQNDADEDIKVRTGHQIDILPPDVRPGRILNV